MLRVAVVGSGIAGLVAARELSKFAQVTLFEAQARFGGLARTIDVSLDGVRHPVDTGFLVFNHRTYPGLTRLFAELGVETAASDMSLSIQRHETGFEWCGKSLDTVFAQRSNAVRPRFWSMLRDLVRLNRLATAWAREEEHPDLTLAEFLERNHLGVAFRDDYPLPMIASIWSCPTDQMLQFPLSSLIRFCHNHGLLSLSNRPQWHTVRGGSREYVGRLVGALRDARAGVPVREVRPVPPASGSAGVWVCTDHGSERFDEVVLACHAPQCLALLPDATDSERAILAAVRTQRNRAVLHTDASVLPRRRRAWAAWNFEAGPGTRAVCLHYLTNRLQPLPWKRPVIESLNPQREPSPETVIDVHDFDHPVFDQAAIAAQRRLHEIQGQAGVWFCGAWTGHGFHEDGLRAATAVVESMRATMWRSRRSPWSVAA